MPTAPVAYEFRQRPLPLWRGDDDAPFVWDLTKLEEVGSLAGADALLLVQWGAGNAPAAMTGEYTRTSGEGALTVDAARLMITWAPTAADFAIIPRGAPIRYELKRIREGRIRTLAWGDIRVNSALMRDPSEDTGPAGQSYTDLRIAALRSELLAGVGGGNGSPPPAAGQVFTQASASASWSIPHSLGRRPIVAVFDAAGAELLADVSATALLVTVTHAQPTAGSAVLI